MERHEIRTKQKYLVGSYFLKRNWDDLILTEINRTVGGNPPK